tara:strand:- start:14764 stop:15519 length:756 start_codon:yes stop_codon:yes gene_type:complete
MYKFFILLSLIIILLYFFYQKNYEGYQNNNIKISVLILSYNRPHNLNKSIPELVKFEEVEEIIILHGNKKFKKEYKHDKVKNIDDWKNNDEFYTMKRFKNVKYCKNEMVFIMDDDVYPSKDLLKKMIKKYRNDTNNIYGPFKRLCNHKGYIWNPSNEYNNILTPLMLTSKSVIINVFKKMLLNKKFFQLVINQKGNCEDLFFNYEFNKLYKKNPIYVEGKYIMLDDKNGFSTTNNKEHQRLRNNFCKNIYK